MRTCCCVGYLTNPGGRCCMDMPMMSPMPQGTVWTSDKITVGPGTINFIPGESTIVAMGWQCPLCKTVYAPHVDACECQIEVEEVEQ